MAAPLKNGRRWIFVGSVSAFLAVALGAFGAHGIKSSVEPELLMIFETAVRYQFYHALALVFYGLWQLTEANLDLSAGATSARPRSTSRWLWWVNDLPAWGFLKGTVLFSGSLYLMVATGVRALGMVTPLGGLAFLVGWISLAHAAVVRSRR